MIVADGTKVEEFAIAVADYLEQQKALKALEAKFTESKDAIRGYHRG